MMPCLVWFVWAEIILIPVLGIIWYGIRTENERKERLLRASLKALGIIVVARGKGRRKE